MPRGKKHKQRMGQCKTENSVHSQSIEGETNGKQLRESYLPLANAENFNHAAINKKRLAAPETNASPSNHLGPGSSELMKGLKGLLDSPRMTVYRP
jgi:hypothetical protein